MSASMVVITCLGIRTCRNVSMVAIIHLEETLQTERQLEQQEQNRN